MQSFFKKTTAPYTIRIIKEVKAPSRALALDFDQVLFDDKCVSNSKSDIKKIKAGVPIQDTQPIYLFLTELLPILREAKRTDTMVIILTGRIYDEKQKDYFFSIEKFLQMIRSMVLEDYISMVIYTNQNIHLKVKVMEDLHEAYFPTKSKKHLCLVDDNFEILEENQKAGFNVIAAGIYKSTPYDLGIAFDFVPQALRFIQAYNIDAIELQKESLFIKPGNLSVYPKPTAPRK